jgi:hypothetical protein
VYLVLKGRPEQPAVHEALRGETPDGWLTGTCAATTRSCSSEWRSDGGQPVDVSYHWLSPARTTIEFDGLRSALPRALGPGDTCRVTMTVRAPQTPGACWLAIDLVKEGVTWFSEAGSPCHTVRIDVR